MQLIDPQLLENLIHEPDAGFEIAFRQMGHPDGADLRPFLIFLDKVLTYKLSREEVGLRCTHFHFPELFAGFKDALLEFIVIRSFFRSLEKDRVRDGHIHDRIASLKSRLDHNQAPAEAKAAKGGNLAYRNWLADKDQLKKELTLLRSVDDPQKSLWPDTILNILNNDLPFLNKSLFAMTIEDLKEGTKRSYNLLNVDLTIEGLIRELREDARLRNIRQVILFDCDTRRTFYSYGQRTLDSLIQRGYPIKDLILFSFDKRPFRMRMLINRLGIIYRRYFLPPQQTLSFEHTYVVEQQELDQLLSNVPYVAPIHWIGERSELFIDYSDLVIGYGIGKLRSLSTLNIYATALNEVCADAIMAHLFNAPVRSSLFDAEMTADINALDSHEKEVLKAAVSGLLQLVIHAWGDIKNEMRKYTGRDPVGIVVPFALIESSLFRKELRAILPDKKINIYTWKDIRDEKCKEKVIFILAYRDPGKYPFDIYPSLLEQRMDGKVMVVPLLLGMFFRDRYERCLFSYFQVKVKILRDEFRYKFLDWKNVEAGVQKTRPLHLEDTPDENEDDDDIIDVAESVKIDYDDDSHATFYLSRLLITRLSAHDPLTVIRADELPEDAEHCTIQPLDELYEDLNLFQITPNEEQELQLIKERYGVLDSSHALWKVLLVRRLDQEGGCQALYGNIEDILKEKGFVRYEYFRDHWLDVKSDLLIPRKRRHFRLICDHLGLPPAYYRLKLKKRSSMVMSSRKSNFRMNALLTQMINEGLFEPKVNWAARDLRHLMELHGLEEKGIDENNLHSELQSLVHLLQEKIQLKKIQKIERS